MPKSESYTSLTPFLPLNSLSPHPSTHSPSATLQHARRTRTVCHVKQHAPLQPFRFDVVYANLCLLLLLFRLSPPSVRPPVTECHTVRWGRVSFSVEVCVVVSVFMSVPTNACVGSASVSCKGSWRVLGSFCEFSLTVLVRPGGVDGSHTASCGRRR